MGQFAIISHLINPRWIDIPEETIHQQLVRLGIRIWKDQIIYVGNRPRHYLFGGRYAYPYSLPVATVNKLARRLNKTMTWYKHYNDEAQTYFNQHGVALNQAVEYWKSIGDITLPRPHIVPVILTPGTEYVAVIGLFHLSGVENGNNHHLYIDLIDREGNRIYDPSLFLRWGWEGISHDEADHLSPIHVDKPNGEPGANIGLTWGQVVFGFSSTTDAMPSDKIKQIHIRYGNDGEGNNQGHHSHYVVLQRRTYVGDLPDPPDPLPPEMKGTIRLEVDRDYFNSLPVDDQNRVDLIIPIYAKPSISTEGT